MITTCGKKIESEQDQITGLDTRLKEIDKTLCSRISPLQVRGREQKIVEPRSQLKAVIYFLGELMAAIIIAVFAVEMMKKLGVHETTFM